MKLSVVPVKCMINRHHFQDDIESRLLEFFKDNDIIRSPDYPITTTYSYDGEFIEFTYEYSVRYLENLRMIRRSDQPIIKTVKFHKSLIDKVSSKYDVPVLNVYVTESDRLISKGYIIPTYYN